MTGPVTGRWQAWWQVDDRPSDRPMTGQVTCWWQAWWRAHYKPMTVRWHADDRLMTGWWQADDRPIIGRWQSCKRSMKGWWWQAKWQADDRPGDRPMTGSVTGHWQVDERLMTGRRSMIVMLKVDDRLTTTNDGPMTINRQPIASRRQATLHRHWTVSLYFEWRPGTTVTTLSMLKSMNLDVRHEYRQMI